MKASSNRNAVMPRRYLYVPYEDRYDVEARGARWDAASRRWYLTARHDVVHFKRWLSPAVQDSDESSWVIESNEACIAVAQSSCGQCGAKTPVLAIYCMSGLCRGQLLENFSVMHITAVNDTLERQLAPWPFFRSSLACFRNHCLRCQAPQDDMALHCEPESAFFRMDLEARVSMSIVALSGWIRLNGEETFEIG